AAPGSKATFARRGRPRQTPGKKAPFAAPFLLFLLDVLAVACPQICLTTPWRGATVGGERRAPRREAALSSSGPRAPSTPATTPPAAPRPRPPRPDRPAGAGLPEHRPPAGGRGAGVVRGRDGGVRPGLRPRRRAARHALHAADHGLGGG